MSEKKLARQDITGNVFLSRGRWYARLPLGGGKRHCSPMPWAEHEEQARARVGIMAELAAKVRSTGDAATIETLPSILDRASKSTDPAEIDRLRELVSRIVGGKVVVSRASAAPIGETFGDVAKAWTSGELAKKYPDQVRVKRTSTIDRQRLDRYVIDLLGPVPMRGFTLDHALRVMSALPSELAPATRRHVAQLIGRVVNLAVSPLRLLAVGPLPKGWKPKVREQRQQEAIYTAEADQLVASPAVAVAARLFVGFIAREGMRHEEAERLTWSDVDLAHGIVALHENKTNEPRAWALRPGTARALRRWSGVHGCPDRSSLVFIHEGEPLRLRPDVYRACLLAAGVTRRALHEGGPKTKPSGIHALRALFVTEALARGESEAWVTDRTGHRSSQMIAKYNRQARMFHEVNMPSLGPLDGLLFGEGSTDAAIGIREAGVLGRKSNDAGRFPRVDSNHDSRIQSPLSCL